MKDALFQKNEVEAEISSLNTKCKAESDGLEKLEPIFATLKKIRAVIKEKKVEGYKGMLIDFIEFDAKISSIVDLAGKSKLFSVIVDDMNAAKEILSIN